MSERILLATDGDTNAAVASDYAATIADREGGHLHGVYVIEPRAYFVRAAGTTIVAEDIVDRQDSQRFLEQLEETTAALHVPCTTQSTIGQFNTVISRYVAQHDIDHVIVDRAPVSGFLDRFFTDNRTRLVRQVDAVLTFVGDPTSTRPPRTPHVEDA